MSILKLHSFFNDLSIMTSFTSKLIKTIMFLFFSQMLTWLKCLNLKSPTFIGFHSIIKTNQQRTLHPLKFNRLYVYIQRHALHTEGPSGILNFTTPPTPTFYGFFFFFPKLFWFLNWSFKNQIKEYTISFFFLLVKCNYVPSIKSRTMCRITTAGIKGPVKR